MKPYKSGYPLTSLDQFPLDRKGLFNGKPMSHWFAKSDELLIRCLLDAAQLDYTSIVGAMTTERIINIALSINPQMVKVLRNGRRDWQQNVDKALSQMIGK